MQGRWIRRTLIGAIVTMLLVAGAGWYVVNHYDNRIERVDVFEDLPQAARPTQDVSPTEEAEEAEEGEPLDILLVGSDTREGSNNRYGGDSGARSDTTILMHLPADRSEATLVSIPRDSLVELPACTLAGETIPARSGKFNSAYAEGGPACTIAAVEALSGIRIEHYVEIDFTGLIDVVDALGGVDVYLPEAVQDRDSELDLPAGVSRVDGEEALAFVRARKFDSQGDLGRIGRQQQLLAGLLQEAKSRDVLLNPVKLKEFLDTATEAVRTDPGFGVSQMVELADSTGGLDLSRVRFVTLPVTDLDYRSGGVSYVLLDEDGTKELFAAVAADGPLPAGTEVTTGAYQPGQSPAVAPGRSSGTSGSNPEDSPEGQEPAN